MKTQSSTCFLFQCFFVVFPSKQKPLCVPKYVHLSMGTIQSLMFTCCCVHGHNSMSDVWAQL